MKLYCVISHTHWDREWYMPLEKFRLKLIDLIDRCLRTLEKYPSFIFHLDAQTVVLEDYLAVRESKRAQLEKYIREGRLVVGPWYLQNDLYLTSGEATVRNLLEGSRLCREFGTEPCPVGYLPDQFGNISQLPQILNDFGIHSIVFGRGYSKFSPDGKRLPAKSEFLWRGPDGTEALAVHMKYWYNNAQRFSANIETSMHLLEVVEKLFDDVALTPYLLLMNGVDHLEAQDDLLPILEQLNQRLPEGKRVEQMRLDRYIQLVQEDLERRGVSLPVHEGELREGTDWDVLKGTLSSRSYLKTANVRAQNMLEHVLEPLYSLLYYYGGKEVYSQDHFRYLWKKLMQNHPHDSICGCSRDEVHAHMEDNYARIGEMSEAMVERGMKTLAEHMDAPKDALYKIMAVNTTETARSGPVSVELDILETDGVPAFTLEDSEGNPVDFQIRSAQAARRDVFSPINLPGVLDVTRYELDLYVKDLPPFSARSYFVKKRDSFPAQSGETASDGTYRLENEFLTVTVDPSGRVDLTDKRTGVQYPDLLELEDTADRGDSYVYFSSEDPAIYGSRFPAQVEMTEAGAFRQACRITRVLQVPEHYNFEKKARSTETANCNVALDLMLEQGVPYLKIGYALDNRARDHRIRLLVRTGIDTAESVADIPFDLVSHRKEDHYPLTMSRVLPNTSFAMLQGENGSMAVLTEGTHEYEHLEESRALAFTLVRSTGVISRNANLEFTNGDTWLCPDNQCLRVLRGNLAAVPLQKGEEDQAALLATVFRTPVLAYADACDPHKFSGGRTAVQDASLAELFYLDDEYPGLKVPENRAMVQVEGKGLTVSALKRAEDGKGLILRVVNLSPNAVTGKIACKGQIVVSSMSETDTEKAASGLLEHSFRPMEILTLRILPA